MPDTRIRSRGSGNFTVSDTSCTKWWPTLPWDCTTHPDRTYGWYRQVSSDELHDWPAKGGTTMDVGGPFHVVRSRVTADWDFKRSYTLGANSNDYKFTGGIVPQLTPYEWNFVNQERSAEDILYWADPSPESTLIAEGTKAIAATIPTNPSADTAVTVAELFREGFPSLIGSTFAKDKASFFRNLGSEYLNVEFGWKPFISGFLEIADSISESEKLLQQLARDSGRNVRRQIAFPEERSTEWMPSALRPSTNASVYLLDVAPGGGIFRKTYSKSWFSGSYTYHYDPADLSEASRIATQARLLLGLKIDPEVLWNLAPWSWLVDWFTNIGPVLHNLSAFGQDGLVLRYGYLMHHYTRRDEHTYQDVSTIRGGNFPTGTRHAAFSLESKRRIRATPYGFGLNMSSLSARQWSILTALGMTKLG